MQLMTIINNIAKVTFFWYPYVLTKWLYLPTETFQIMRQTRAHEGSVFTLCSLQGGAVLSGGGKDRKIIRWSADLAPERECEVNLSCVCVHVCEAGV